MADAYSTVTRRSMTVAGASGGVTLKKKRAPFRTPEGNLTCT